jgi:hypothetical protein
MSLLPERIRADQEFYHVVIDRYQINLQQIQGWIKICDEEHGEVCRAINGTGSLPLPPSMLLIDVRDMCLVEAYEQVSYICLSYVWGSEQNQFQAVMHNLQELRQPGFLSAIVHQLPASVRDAISLTAKLGMRYLWIDRLCILQDDAIHQSTQIRYMAGIYNNACFTICATDGEDAEYGLRGIGQGSRPRDYEQIMFRFGSTARFVVCEEDFHENDTTKWYTRGWTYQERLLSNRRLVFNHQLVKWVCRKAFWSETMNPGCHPIPDDIYGPQHSLIPQCPLLNDYFGLAQYFKARKLGDEKDGLNAFAGIISSLNKSFPGGFHFGLPQCMFDHALLWRTGFKDFAWRPAQRKEFFPSWSWVGWNGPIEWYMCAGLYSPQYKEVEFSIELKSMVKWKRATKYGEYLDLKVLYDYWRSYQDNTIKTPPPGWRRVIENDTIHYVHEALSTADLGYGVNALLYHPVPTHRATSLPDDREWTHVLHGRVHTTRFSLGRITFPLASSRLEVIDKNDVRVGHIDPDVEFKSRYDRLSSECFIGISKRVATRYGVHYVSIHVLWIEWKDEIVYRLGVGEIDEQAWLDASPKEINIQLG